MSCPICVEKFNKTSRVKVVCSCGGEFCLSCVNTYLNTSDEICCMECKKEWSYDTLKGMMKQGWLKKHYPSFFKSKIIRYESKLLSNSMVDVEKELLSREWDKERETIRDSIGNVRDVIEQLEEYLHYPDDNLLTSTTTINDLIGLLTAEVGELKFMKDKNLSVFGEPSSKRKQGISKPCTNIINEVKCKGFLNEKFNCGICSAKFCKDCFVHLTEEKHVCKKEDVDTATLLKKETKNCPSCGTSIFKTEGCDVMWCTGCNSAFNWVSGEPIRNKAIHNPHYFEYIDKLVSEENNSDQVWLDTVVNYQALRARFDQTCYSKYATYIQSVLHIYDTERPNPELYREDVCRNVRVRYLLNEISDEKFADSCVRKMREWEKEKRLAYIIDELFIQSQTLLNSIVQRIQPNKVRKGQEFKTPVHIVNELNTGLQAIIKKYNEDIEPYSKTVSKIHSESLRRNTFRI